MFTNMMRGFLMAMADSIPGVSGGTIAYILGFYDTFINAFANLFTFDKKKRKESLSFLAQLGTGWIISFVICLIALATLFETHIYTLSSALIGLTLFSIPTISINEYRLIEEKKKGWGPRILLIVIGLIFVIALTRLNPQSQNPRELANLSLSLGLYIFCGGVVAISALILPGISGSSLIMIMGFYLPILSAIRGLLDKNFQYFIPLALFGIGIITGLFTSVTVVQKLLKTHRDGTMYFILGMVIGALYAIIQGPTTLHPALAPLSFSTFSIIGFICGGFIILRINFLSSTKERKILETV